MKFDAVNCTIFKADGGSAFKFSPAPSAERFAQAGNLAYPVADGNRFDLFDPTDDLEIFVNLISSTGTQPAPTSSITPSANSLS